MIFGRVPLHAAEGAVLAHTTRVGGRLLRKGTVLDAAAVMALRMAGVADLIAAQLEPGDVSEDEAAQRLGDALASPALPATRAATGRVNLVAARAGLLAVDAPAVHAMNAVAEGITIATLADGARVAPGEVVATIKIIPFAVSRVLLDTAAARGRTHGAALRLHPWCTLRVGLVLSTLAHLKPSVIEGTIAATRARVEALGGALLPPKRCAHDGPAIADALAGLLDQGADLLLVAGASAVVDRADVGPSGIVAAGGEIEHFGMPVDPGNLICLGRVGAVPALVLPGCARSPRPNGIDWVLQRLFAGLPCGGTEVAAMGVGGLLKEVAARPLRRARATRPSGRHGRAPVAAIVLAAGRSSRMAPQHKLLLADHTGLPMIARVVDQALASRARPVIVVTGFRGADVRAALLGRPVDFVEAGDHADGLSASLRAGLAAVPAAAPAAIVVLGDMPLVTGAMLDQLMAAHRPDQGRTIVAASHQGAIGNPVLWDRCHFAELSRLTGDRGGRALLTRHAEAVVSSEIGEAALTDIDTPEALAGLIA